MVVFVLPAARLPCLRREDRKAANRVDSATGLLSHTFHHAERMRHPHGQATLSLSRTTLPALTFGKDGVTLATAASVGSLRQPQQYVRTDLRRNDPKKEFCRVVGRKNIRNH
jgi:hypothetical protein